ncbi:MAG: tyrosine-protein phosphatase [Capsulimonadales bacterium]|nr:tyrosine-protein phosphatase [Capsulimonadales bacterium]
MRSADVRNVLRLIGCLVSGLTVPLAAQAQEAAPAAQPVAPVIDPKSYVRVPEEEATMTRNEKGAFIIAWTVPADSVEVFLVADPDRTIGPNDKADRIAIKKSRVALMTLEAKGRRYAILRFRGGAWEGKTWVVGERRLPLEGLGNLRDAGGYRTEEGRQVRWGMLYRSEALARLTDADREYLNGLQLKTVCDFRGNREAEAAPDKLAPIMTARAVSFPIESGTITRPSATGTTTGTTTTATTATTVDLSALIKTGLGVAYMRMLDEHGKSAFGPFVRALAEPANLPTLYHCTAGKDRTGVATALVLRVLGVPTKTIVADYSLTNLATDALMEQAKRNPQLAASGLNSARMMPLMIADPKWMEDTLRYVEEKHGSVENYLTTVCGVEKATIDKLRARLLH